MKRLVSLLLLLVLAPVGTAGPKVDVVVGPAAPRLERRAADELARQLRQLVGAEVTVAEKEPGTPGALILVGSPATNPAVRRWIGRSWPRLGEQGHLLRSVEQGGNRALVVGGGSPVATLWAAFELGHHLGLRSLLDGDLPPASSPTLKLDNINIVREPVLRRRAWRTLGPSPVGQASWGLADHKRLLGQLAKMKFNRVVLEFHPGQPFLPHESGAAFWPGPAYRVDGDTAGRQAFQGARFFDNPDLAGKATQSERRTAAVALARGILDHAHELGMTAVVSLAWPGSEEELRTRLRNCLETYPALDGIEVRLPEKSDVTEVVRRLLAEPGLSRRKDGPAPEMTVATPTQTGRSLILPLSRTSVLPQMPLERLHAAVARMRKDGLEGYSAVGAIPGDLSAAVYYLSRASFDARITPKQACTDLITAMCGEGVAERILRGFEWIEEAADLLERDGANLGRAAVDLVKQQGVAKAAPPAWSKAAKLYAQAMDEMYRGQQRAPGRVRPWLVYHAKRLEFAMGYLGSAEALRGASVAKAKGDREKQVAQLEKATESIYNALGALGEVARDSSDRAVIALLNAHAYRPLRSALDEAEKE